MVDFENDKNDRRAWDESLDAARHAAEPQEGHDPHPLFPREDGSPEHRDIHLVSFRRRRSDGRIDNTPEDIPAGEIHSWAQVVGRWGGGEYQALGKDKNHRVVAWYPEKNGEWLLFDQESKPFKFRDGRDVPSLHVPAAPPAPVNPPALTPLETALFDLVRELRSSQAASTFSIEAALVEMIKSQGELLRTVVLTQPLSEASSRQTVGPTDVANQLLRALRESATKPPPRASAGDWREAHRRRAMSGRRIVRGPRKRP